MNIMATNISLARPLERSSEKFVTLIHEINADGTIIRSIALDAGTFEALFALISLLVFVRFLRWIFGI